MSDKGSSSPSNAGQNDDSASHSPKSPRSPRESASTGSPARGDRSPRDQNGEAAAEREDRSERRAASSRSPSPARSKEAAADVDPEAANPGNNLYVANLAHRITQTDLEEIFSKFGRLDKCEVILDPVTRDSRGFAFVTFEDVRDANDAVNELNGKEIQGRRIRVEHAKRKRGHEKTPGKYLGPRLASTKYGRDGRGGGRDRSRERGDRYRSRSRSRERGGYSRRYDDRDRYDRRYDDRGDRGRGGYDRDRYDGRRSRR
uniref:RRM domain-containing protein n=1 Tax=Globisporangium ultimum (strain ATCC 200006 / CBS 805.95 / DAOM BR144) TaxID=431595 RepID=K3W7V0_GLOUD